MQLIELSKDYEAHAVALRGRIVELKVRLPLTKGTERDLLKERVRLLTVMWREARELAVLTARYYERGYRRNVRYTL